MPTSPTRTSRTSRLTYANVVSTVALVIAVGGGGAVAHAALAKNSVGSPQIKNGQVKTVDLGRNAVTTKKIKPRAVGSPQLKDAAVAGRHLAPGSVGLAQLGQAPMGVAKAYLWNDVSDGPLMTPRAVDPQYAFNSAGGAATVTRTATGAYEVGFEGLAMDRGTVLVTAYGTNAASCQVASWSESTATVLCFGLTAAPVDSRFTIAYVD